MMTLNEITQIVNAITYKDGWGIHCFTNINKDIYIQISATTPCSVTREPTHWKSGKTYLSKFMCRQEIVAAVYGAIEKAELHEIREFFRYKGASIFNPHLDPDVLAEVAKKKSSFNVRENAMSMIESLPANIYGG